MPFYSGQNGELFIDNASTPAAKVRSWQFSSNASTLETTTLGDRDRTTVQGIRNLTGTCDLFYYAADPNDTSTNSASVLLNKLIKQASGGSNQGADSTPVNLKFVIKDGTATNKFIQGNCLLTGASMTMAVGEVLSASISFEFVGAPSAMLL